MPVLLLLGHRNCTRSCLVLTCLCPKWHTLKKRRVWGPSGLREGKNFISLRPRSQENSSWLNSSLLSRAGKYIASSLLSKSLISRFPLTPSTLMSGCAPFAQRCLAAQMASAGPLAILLGLQARMGLRWLLLRGTSVCEYLRKAWERRKKSLAESLTRALAGYNQHGICTCVPWTSCPAWWAPSWLDLLCKVKVELAGLV